MILSNSPSLDSQNKKEQTLHVCKMPVVEKTAEDSTIQRKLSATDTDRVFTSNTCNESTTDQQQLDATKSQPQATAATAGNTINATRGSISFTLASGDSSDDAQTLPEDYTKKLVAQIHRRLDTFLSNSPYIRSSTELHSLPRFTPGHLNLGKTIAKGGFSNIIEVNSFNNEECLLKPASSEDEEDAGVTTAKSSTSSKGEYVVKCLSTKLALKKLPGATKDIVFEAHTLAALNHDHIIKLRGWSHEGIAGFQTSLRADGFFLILDRLEDTLFQRVFQWQNELKGRGKFGNFKKKISTQKILRHQLHEKIQITVDVASALAYCHARRIIHRDIKSANVAFDRDGRAKLIDFGLAVEVPKRIATNPHRTFELTGNIGTARYMSPECILEKPYNEKSDVHSFAVLCWEACAAKKPYSSLDAKKVKEHVSKWNERPKLYWSWPRRLRKVMKQGWARRPEDRPSMAEFHKSLVKVQNSLPKSSIDFAAMTK